MPTDLPSSRVDRRTFLIASVALARSALFADERLETFTEWSRASRATRAAHLPALVERIRAADAQLQAWVQVKPEPPIRSGALSDIPFGVKDIIETAGLA